MNRLALGGLLLAALVCATIGPAWAWGNRISNDPGNHLAITPPPVNTLPRVVYPPPRAIYRPYLYNPYYQQAYPVPRYSSSGYWAYQWVPAGYTRYAWMPGYIDQSGTWCPGSYQTQVVPTGYYQRVWVSGY